MWTIDDLYELSQDEIIKVVLEMQDYIFDLEHDIKKLKNERTEKINKDYQGNRKLVIEILNNFV